MHSMIPLRQKQKLQIFVLRCSVGNQRCFESKISKEKSLPKFFPGPFPSQDIVAYLHLDWTVINELEMPETHRFTAN